jgi:hypothetical protein
MATDVTEACAVNKPGKSQPRPLKELLHKTLGDAFAKQGFASTELVTRWPDIVGAEIAAHSQPEKIQWPRAADGGPPEPGAMVLRVEGPTAIEIQHLSGVILERVNRFLGWQAVGSLRLKQAPLRRGQSKAHPTADPEAAARIAAGLPEIRDEKLRDALARLGAAIKQS